MTTVVKTTCRQVVYHNLFGRRVRIEAGSITTGPDRLRARQPCTACSSTQNVRLPRWTSARLYSDPFLTWYRKTKSDWVAMPTF